MITIRTPSIKSSRDVAYVMRAFHALAAMYATRRKVYDPRWDAHNIPHLEKFIDKHYLRLAVTRSGESVGVIGCTVGEHPFNPLIRTMATIFWHATPGPQQARAGLALMDDAISYGRKHADWLIFTLMAHNPTGANALKRRGFRLQEQTYLMEV